jgi:hypothetical protein
MWDRGGHYALWADSLERWGRGDPVDLPGLPALRPEDFPPDTWGRFAQRLGDATSARLAQWGTALENAMRGARDVFEVGRALAQSRHGLRAVRAVTEVAGLPEDLRGRLLEQIDRNVKSMQQQLEDQVQRERTVGASSRLVEARLRTLRENRLTVVVEERARPVDDAGGWGRGDAGDRPRRRILRD